MVDQQGRESEGKAKIKGYMSVSDEEAHHRNVRFLIGITSHDILFQHKGGVLSPSVLISSQKSLNEHRLALHQAQDAWPKRFWATMLRMATNDGLCVIQKSGKKLSKVANE